MQLKLNNDIKKDNIIGEYSKYYSVYNDDKCIGCCGTNEDSNSMIYIYLDSEYRGNGLGTELFKEMVINTKKYLGMYDISHIDLIDK